MLKSFFCLKNKTYQNDFATNNTYIAIQLIVVCFTIGQIVRSEEILKDNDVIIFQDAYIEINFIQFNVDPVGFKRYLTLWK